MTVDGDDGFFSVAHRQRACRDFAPEPVPDALVTAVLGAAVRAPSAENAQPWEFVVVHEAETKATIVGAMRDAWDHGARAYAEPRLSPRVFADVENGVRSGLAAAPLLVVVAADTERVHPDAVGASLFPAIQNLLLAATALGLGSALTTLAVTRGAAVAEAVGLPEGVVPVAVLPLGYPARPLGPGRRRPLETVAHRERFGRPWDSPG